MTINDARSANDAKPMTINDARSANDAKPMTINDARNANDAKPMTINDAHSANDAKPMTSSEHFEIPTCIFLLNLYFSTNFLLYTINEKYSGHQN
jgi:hypothetical protein